MIEIVAFAAAGVAGAWAFLLMKRSRAHNRWKGLLEEAATKLGGRASPATMFDAPELRATLEDVTVTLKLRDIHKPESGVASAEARLAGLDERLRIYLGWDVAAAPPGLEHVPELDYGGAAFVEGKVVLRGSDAVIAKRFVELAAIDLVDLRREANARALEVICRGGYLDLRAHGMTESPHMVERLAIVSARLVRLALEAATGRKLGPGASPSPAAPSPAAPAGDARCPLCMGAQKAGETWVACSRCGSPYHQNCWQQATGCLVEGCDETKSRPL